MKKYVAPAMMKVVLDPKEAYNTSYNNCILGETNLLQQEPTYCTEIHKPWNDATLYSCYLEPTV